MILLFTIGAIGLSHVQTTHQLQQLEKENAHLKLLSSRISDQEISKRLAEELDKLGVSRIIDLTEISENELSESPTFGETSMIEFRELLNKLKLSTAKKSTAE